MRLVAELEVGGRMNNPLMMGSRSSGTPVRSASSDMISKLRFSIYPACRKPHRADPVEDYTHEVLVYAEGLGVDEFDRWMPFFRLLDCPGYVLCHVDAAIKKEGMDDDGRPRPRRRHLGRRRCRAGRTACRPPSHNDRCSRGGARCGGEPP